ncbi:hypothetical protein NQ317_008369 [Molorchus minor]|uniref:ATPase dynein-related AAA domain-containing protein n=1 Tax=Molorchus minor TaxID=1323400 RepID=A0ABQ9K411_9CUCU|nr:hypothetical protein NQ317_008369 [Molorchus minor]
MANLYPTRHKNGNTHIIARFHVLREYMDEMGSSRFNRPALSSDLNPFKHVWDELSWDIEYRNPFTQWLGRGTQRHTPASRTAQKLRGAMSIAFKFKLRILVVSVLNKISQKMFSNSTRFIRVKLLLHNVKYFTKTRYYVTKENITIGNITKEIKEAKHLEYIPRKYYKVDNPQSTLHHLRWILQKDVLGQDVFLLGPPGPRKRNIAMQYLELTNREHEYVALSRDTTESDIKQRREIVRGTAKYFDQSVVRAAIEGRVLILEGIEKAERNVLPVLNNLLENREMHLEDGRLLIPASRYDSLLKDHGEKELGKWKLVRVDENFRVIALGLPVPRYRGNPLDPPLRSRFQARDVYVNSYQEWYKEMRDLAPSAQQDKIRKILSCAYALLSKESMALGLPDFPWIIYR